MIKIIGWILKYHPHAKFFVENLDFSDMEDHWLEVCNSLGTPTIVSADTVSFTRRRRAYWTNFEIPKDWNKHLSPQDPNTVLDDGRRIQKHVSTKGLYVKPIGASWSGDENSPTASTNAPVLVFDEAYDEPQHLRPHEAEGLMGMEPGTTEGEGITALLRLKCIGASWDINVTSALLSHFEDESQAALAVIECMINSFQESPLTEEQINTARVLYHVRKHNPEKYTEVINSINATEGKEKGYRAIAMTEYFERLMFMAAA